MKTRYRLIRRGSRSGAFYCVDTKTGKRTSLQTSNEDEAQQIIEAKNQSERQPVLNLQIAKAYLAGTDSGISQRTWQQALEALTNSKHGVNQERWRRAGNDQTFDLIRHQVIIETQGDTLLKVLQQGTVSTVGRSEAFLRRAKPKVPLKPLQKNGKSISDRSQAQPVAFRTSKLPNKGATINMSRKEDFRSLAACQTSRRQLRVAASFNIYLRRLHNFCLDMNWLPWPMIPKRQWPEIKFKEKRGITWQEHQKILAGESNTELRDYYELLWHLGGSQTDMASLRAEDLDWRNQTISYSNSLSR